MAKPYTAGRVQNDDHSFTPDKDGNAARNVVDIESHELLTAISTALGGSTDTTVNIYNIGTTANTELSQVLPANCKGFIIRCRVNARTQLSYLSGQTNTAFFTIRPGNTYKDENFYSNQTIYFRTSKDDTIEIIAFS